MSEKRPGIDKVVEYLKGLKDPIVIDLGAHVGKTTQMWLDAGAGKVYAVEPCQEINKQLSERFKGDGRVKVLVAAVVGEEAEDVSGSFGTLYIPDDFKGKDRTQGCTLYKAPLKSKKRKGTLSGYNKEPVMLGTLGGLKRFHGLDIVDLLKVNIEGAEYEALKNIPDGIKAIFVSWHSHPPFDSEEYHQQYANICGEFDSKGMECISCESRGDHTWEFWKVDE